MLMDLFDSEPHDDDARARGCSAGGRGGAQLLLLMQACAPGPPMIYQGTEVGQIGALGRTAAAATRTTARRFLGTSATRGTMTCCRTPEKWDGCGTISTPSDAGVCVGARDV